MPGSEEAIRELIEARSAAVFAADAGQALAPLSDDSVVYDLQPPLQFSGAAARDAEGLTQWFATWDGPITIEMPDPKIAVDGDLAFVHGLSHLQGVKRGVGPSDLWFRTTLCLKRAAGTWSIVHEHASFPMMMDGSGLAAVDLKPEDGDPRQ